MVDLHLGTFRIALVTDSDGGRFARIALPDGSGVVGSFSPDGELEMRLGLGLGLSYVRPVPSGGAPAWLPEGAVAYADFVNGHYYGNGGEVAVSALLGGGFDPSAISASGMLITPGNANRPTASGGLLTALTSNDFIAVFQIYPLADDYQNLLELADATNSVFAYVDALSANSLAWESNDTAVSSAPLVENAINTVTLTLTAGEITVKLNGGDIGSTDTGTLPASYSSVSIGWNSQEMASPLNGYIRSIAVYPNDGGGGTPEWLPDGATDFADPRNGHYYTDEEEVTAADVFSDPSKIVGGDGLAFSDGDTVQTLLGAFASSMLTMPYRFVLDVDVETTDTGAVFLSVNNEADTNELVTVFVTGTGQARVASFDSSDNGGTAQSVETITTISRHKIAGRVSANEVAISLDGATPVTANAGGMNPVATQVVLGGIYNDDTIATNMQYTLRSLTKYPDGAAATLATLSAL